MKTTQHDFDLAIGRLDRVLSELLVFADLAPDAANVQTLKHHAEDMIGVGNKILKLLGLDDGHDSPQERKQKTT